MNFIIEILPKKENSNVFVYVVRVQNGYPLAVCDSLEGAMIVIQDQHDELLAQASKKS